MDPTEATPGPVRNGRGRYCTPRSQVMDQAGQVSTGSFSLADGHLQGAGIQVGHTAVRWPASPRSAARTRQSRKPHRPTRRNCARRRGYLPLAGECRRATAHPGRRPRSAA